MHEYSSKEVARLLDLKPSQIRSFTEAGILEPERGPRGEFRFSFQDLVLLRTAKGLLSSSIKPRRVRSTLTRLRDQVPLDGPLSAVQLEVDGGHILARRGLSLWDPESGQTFFNFDARGKATPLDKLEPHGRRKPSEPQNDDDNLDAEEWCALGVDLEGGAPEHAREAYRRCLELDPVHEEARVNLGRILHEAGQLRAAESHYRLALTHHPANGTALFNLGVVLEDQGKDADAIKAYERALEHDPRSADACYNLARLLEKTGDTTSALRYLATYRRLTD